MAKAAAAKKSTNTDIMEITFRHERETKGANRFAEELVKGGPEKGYMGTIYLKKPLLEGSSVLTITVSEGTPDDVHVLDGKGKLVVPFTYEKDTKNTVRFQENEIPGGERPVVGTAYFQQSMFSGEVPQHILLTIVG